MSFIVIYTQKSKKYSRTTFLRIAFTRASLMCHRSARAPATQRGPGAAYPLIPLSTVLGINTGPIHRRLVEKNRLTRRFKIVLRSSSKVSAKALSLKEMSPYKPEQTNRSTTER